MAYFGRTPKKPQSLPGSASGRREQEVTARLTGIVRQVARGRQERQQRVIRSIRVTRNERKGR